MLSLEFTTVLSGFGLCHNVADLRLGPGDLAEPQGQALPCALQKPVAVLDNK